MRLKATFRERFSGGIQRGRRTISEFAFDRQQVNYFQVRRNSVEIFFTWALWKPYRGGMLLAGRIRIELFWCGSSTEGQLEFEGDLRPEFAERVETHVAKNAETYRLGCWREAALVARMVEITQRDSTRCP